MQQIMFMNAFGVARSASVLATFEDNGRTFYVIPCARGTYDVGEPYTVIAEGDLL